jgi:hypothetical protein
MSTPISPNSISVTVNPTFWDVYVASLTLIRYRGALIIVHAIFPLLGLFGLVFVLCVRHHVGADDALIALLAFSFTPLVTALAVWTSRRRNKLAQGPFTYSFDAEGMHTSATAFDQTIKWPAIMRVRQSKRFLFIFVSPSRAFCLPLKALTEQGVLDEVRSIACEHTDFR